MSVQWPNHTLNVKNVLHTCHIPTPWCYFSLTFFGSFRRQNVTISQNFIQNTFSAFVVCVFPFKKKNSTFRSPWRGKRTNERTNEGESKKTLKSAIAMQNVFFFIFYLLMTLLSFPCGLYFVIRRCTFMAWKLGIFYMTFVNYDDSSSFFIFSARLWTMWKKREENRKTRSFFSLL